RNPTRDVEPYQGQSEENHEEQAEQGRSLNRLDPSGRQPAQPAQRRDAQQHEREAQDRAAEKCERSQRQRPAQALDQQQELVEAEAAEHQGATTISTTRARSVSPAAARLVKTRRWMTAKQSRKASATAR